MNIGTLRLNISSSLDRPISVSTNSPALAVKTGRVSSVLCNSIGCRLTAVAEYQNLCESCHSKSVKTVSTAAAVGPGQHAATMCISLGCRFVCMPEMSICSYCQRMKVELKNDRLI